MTGVMRRMIPMALLAAIVVVQALALTACNTAEGFGKDVKKTGEAMEEGARDAKRDLK